MLREHIVAFHDNALNICYIVDSDMLPVMLRITYSAYGGIIYQWVRTL
jgi:hypothetical protein